MIKKVVLTGGPCAGKTSAIKVMQQTAEKYDWRYIVIPEVARIFISSGMDPRKLKGPANKKMQLMIVTTQVTLEKAAREYLSASGFNGVIICDRGVCDNGAYIERHEYRDILLKAGLGEIHDTHYRYDAVFHMQSAAVGAVEHYKTDEVRTDSVEDAAKLETLTQMQWDSHPNFNFIPNPSNGGFEAKLEILRDYFIDELRRS